MTPANSSSAPSRPPHVPADRVYDFDLYDFPGSADDVHAALRAIRQSSPDIFWTPRNGGHWVVTGSDDIKSIQLDYRRFSHASTVVPPMPPGTPPVIPIELDPPRHSQFRRPLMQLLRPSVVAELDTKVRQLAIDAIERLAPSGECEFVTQFARVLPIEVFFSLVQLPGTDKERLLELADDAVRGSTVELRTAALGEMAHYLSGWVGQRREAPGDDLLSAVVNVEVDGAKISYEEALSYASLVLFAGLDTVATMLSFIALFLARHPDHRRQLLSKIDDEAYLQRAIEELLRRHGLSNTSRLVTEDCIFKNIEFRAGDRVMPVAVLVGLDDSLNPDPLKVDFDRTNAVHAVFGNGAHTCPGASLARREIRIFLEEWLPRIPEFSIKPGTKPKLVTGILASVQRLDLVFA